tara:strand:+ start:253 stop:633 length:381 start_codon:yes stop_codon:yes gene_type:complete
MAFTQHHRLDLANKLVVFEASGHVDHVDKMEIVIKKAINLAHMHNLIGILFDLREVKLSYESIDVIDLLVRMRDEDWLGGLRLARLVSGLGHTNDLVAEIYEKFSLPVKNFESKSKAIAWLLYNYE